MENWFQDILEHKAAIVARDLAEREWIGKTENDGSNHKISLIDDVKILAVPNTSDMNFHFSFYTQAYFPRPEPKTISVPLCEVMMRWFYGWV